MKQSHRNQIMNEFRGSGAKILIGTDLIARGIDVDKVDYVLQIDPPTDPSHYVHRIGRTARAGTTGRAIILLTQNESNYIDWLRNKKIPILNKKMSKTNLIKLDEFTKLIEQNRTRNETDRD